MHLPSPDASWSDDWKALYNYDLMQYFGGTVSQQLLCKQFAPRTALDFRYSSAAYRLRLDAVLRAVRRDVPAGSSIIDLGAAEGNYSLLMAQAGYRVTWNDYIASREGYVRLKMDTESLAFKAGNAFELQGTYDALVALEIIEHVAHPDAFLASCAELLKPGGIAILSTPNGNYLKNRLPKFSDFGVEDLKRFEGGQFSPDGDGHLFALYEDEIRRLVPASGMTLKRVHFYDVPPRLGDYKELLPKVPVLRKYLSPGVLFVCERKVKD